MECRRGKSRSRSDGGENLGLIGACSLRAAMNDHLRSIQRVQTQSLHVSLLPHRPRTRSKRVLPPHVIPVIHMKRQNNNSRKRIFFLLLFASGRMEVSATETREKELCLGRRSASLRGEELHENWARMALFFGGEIAGGGDFGRGRRRPASSETGEEPGRHFRDRKRVKRERRRRRRRMEERWAGGGERRAAEIAVSRRISCCPSSACFLVFVSVGEMSVQKKDAGSFLQNDTCYVYETT